VTVDVAKKSTHYQSWRNKGDF